MLNSHRSSNMKMILCYTPPGRDIYIIEQNLSQDLEHLAEWFTEIELILIN